MHLKQSAIRPPRRSELTKRRLYDAALDVFRRDGVDQSRIDDIARRAEVSRAAFYCYFPTKQHVLQQLASEREFQVAEVLAALPVHASLEATLVAAAEATARAWEAEAPLVADVAAVALRDGAATSQRQAHPVQHELARRFKAFASRKALTAALAPEALAGLFHCNCLAAMVAWSAGSQAPLREALLAVVRLFLDGARPLGAGARA